MVNKDELFLTVFAVILERNMDTSRPTSDLVFAAQDITDEVMSALNKMSKSKGKDDDAG